MVEYADVDGFERDAQLARDGDVGLAGLGDSRGVVVGQDHRGGVIGQAAFHHFPRIDRGAVDGALEQFVEPQDVMLVGQEDATEDLALAIAEAGVQVFPGGLGTAQYVAVLHFGVQLAVAEFAHRRQARGLGRTDAGHAGDLPEACRQQAREPVESLQQIAREVERRLAVSAAAEQQRHEFGVAEILSASFSRGCSRNVQLVRVMTSLESKFG